jgi:hypothetical protein
MVAFPCGRSHGPNIRHQVYFEPERRPNKENIPFIGIYKNKTITHIGRLKKSVIAKAKDLELILSEDADLKDLEKQKILNILNDEETRKNFSDLHNVFRRYYIIHDMIEVNMIKETPHGMPGLRYYDLNKIADGKIQDWNNMDHIAEVLKGKAFEK